MKKGFTLIELLVVIAIIAILAAILFPVFAQAREKARASSCLSNCKQIGTALQLYTDDYDETVPQVAFPFMTGDAGTGTTKWYVADGIRISPGGMDTGARYCWIHAIYPYVKNMSMLCCPSITPKVINKDLYTTSYSYNLLLSYATNRNFDGGIGCNSQQRCLNMNLCSLSMMNNPSMCVFCMDGGVNDVTSGGVPTKAGNVEGGPYLIYPLEASSAYGSNDKFKVVRHNEGLNFTFCDGHAKYFKRDQGPATKSAAKGYWGINDPYWDPSAK